MMPRRTLAEHGHASVLLDKGREGRECGLSGLGCRRASN